MYVITQYTTESENLYFMANDGNADFITGNCYFWGTLITLYTCIADNQNNSKHPFLFKTLDEAVKVMKKEIPSSYIDSCVVRSITIKGLD